MKKRILALALVIVTLVAVLTGCAYRYDRKDMSKYVTVADNYAALNAMLKNISVKGDDFGPYKASDDYFRNDRVMEKIYANLAGKIGSDAAKLNGEAVFGQYQKIFYAYYCTVEKDGVTYYFDTKNMDDAKLQNFVSNPKFDHGNATEELNVTDALTKEIYKQLAGRKIEDYKYDSVSTSSEALKAGDVVFVTYTYSYTDENGASKSVTSEYMRVEVEDRAVVEGETMKATKIGQLLAGKKLGKISGTTDDPLTFEKDGVKYTVDSMTAHFKSTGKEILVDYLAPAAKDYTNAENTATTAKVKVAKDDIITYHIFPAYANAVETLSATAIIKTIFGENISTSSLSIFTENEAMKKIVEEFAGLKTAYEQAKSAVTSAGTNATDAQKKTRDEAEKKMKDALEALPGKLFATNTSAETAIVNAYKESVYDSLEAAFDAAVQKQIAQAIWGWVKTNVKVDTANLPKAAVKEAKDRILASHKNDYHTGQDSTTKIPYTTTFKTFKEYLANVYAGKDANTEVENAAKAEVVEIIRIYAVAQHFNIARVTDADIPVYLDQNYFNIYYQLVIAGKWTSSNYPSPEEIRSIYGDTAIRCALTFDRLMEYFLATEEVDGHVKYTTIKNIHYGA